VIAFDIDSGRELWRLPAEAARGPALAIDSSVYIFAGSGSIRVVRLADGQVTWRHQSSFQFDRAGPAATGSLLVIGALSGEVLGFPRSILDECRRTELIRVFGKGVRDPSRAMRDAH
jgi:outer membrane protein assembly factor BamB